MRPTRTHLLCQSDRPAPPLAPPRGQTLITGNGFPPHCPVTVRITRTGDGVVDYLTYISDADGQLIAALPVTAIIETGHVTVTDHRPHPAGDGGLLWSNTVIITHTSM